MLLLHGWQNRRPADHWQHLLADELGHLGTDVVYPQLPNPDCPRLDVWLETLDRVLDRLVADETTVITHSLGSLLWFNAVARPMGLPRVARLLIVAPPAREVALNQPEIRAFGHFSTTPGQLAGSSETTPLVVGGSQDPWCPGTVADVYGNALQVPTRVIDGAEHFTPADGYGDWPSMLEWVLSDGASTLTGNRP